MTTGAPVPGPLTLALDSEDHRLRGASYGEGDGAETILFDGFEPRQNLLTTADRWTRYDGTNGRVEVLQTKTLVFNSFIEDDVWSARSPESESKP